MPGIVRHRRSDKVSQLYTQADRAKRMAEDCVSDLVGDLYRLHALACERNAAQRQKRSKRRRTNEPAKST